MTSLRSLCFASLSGEWSKAMAFNSDCAVLSLSFNFAYGWSLGCRVAGGPLLNLGIFRLHGNRGSACFRAAEQGYQNLMKMEPLGLHACPELQCVLRREGCSRAARPAFQNGTEVIWRWRRPARQGESSSDEIFAAARRK